MTNKFKKRVREHAEKHGMSYQGTHQQLDAASPSAPPETDQAPASPDDVKALRAAILSYVERSDWVSFAELQNSLGRYRAPEEDPLPERVGDWALTIPERPNTVIWAGMSLAFLDAVSTLLEERRVFLHSGSALSYLCDGGALQFPVAKRPSRSRDYKKPHWLVVFLRTVPHDNPVS